MRRRRKGVHAQRVAEPLYDPVYFTGSLVFGNEMGQSYITRDYLKVTFRLYRAGGAWVKRGIPGTRWITVDGWDRLITVDPNAALRWSRKVGIINEEQFQKLAAKLAAEMMGC